MTTRLAVVVVVVVVVNIYESFMYFFLGLTFVKNYLCLGLRDKSSKHGI